MFTDEETARRRLEGSRNVLRVPEEEWPEVEEPPELEPKPEGSDRDGDKDRDKRKARAKSQSERDDIVLPCLEGPTALADLEQIIMRGGLDNRSHYVGDRQAQRAIGETDALLGPTFTSRIFGNTPPQAQAYGDGLQTPSKILNKQIKEVRDHVEMVKLDIARSASRKLKKVVDCINEERIEAIESPLLLARLGKDIAAIVDRVSPRDQREEDRSIFHIYRPEVASHDEYNIVNISVAPPVPHRVEPFDLASAVDVGSPRQSRANDSVSSPD